MKGSILSYSAEHQIGKILADNQQQYTFTAEHWSETHAPTIGEHIDFEVNESGFITKVTGYLPQNIPIPSFSPSLNSTSHLDPAEANYNMFNWFLKSLKTMQTLKDVHAAKNFGSFH